MGAMASDELKSSGVVAFDLPDAKASVKLVAFSFVIGCWPDADPVWDNVDISTTKYGVIVVNLSEVFIVDVVIDSSNKLDVDDIVDSELGWKTCELFPFKLVILFNSESVSFVKDLVVVLCCTSIADVPWPKTPVVSFALTLLDADLISVEIVAEVVDVVGSYISSSKGFEVVDMPWPNAPLV